MSAGGKRPGAGRKPQTVVHKLILRDSQPEKWREFCSNPDLSPLDVMQENMTFFHERAAQVLASIMLRPLTPDEDAQRIQALADLAGVVRMREMSQQCARDLAPYVHTKADKSKPDKAASRAPELTHIPTPQSVMDAYERAAAGLPPEPRKRL